MPKQIPSYPNPLDPSAPLLGAYGYTSGISLDLGVGSGSAVMNVHPSKAAADARALPAGQLRIGFGQVLAPGVVAATVPEFLALPVDPTLKAAFDANPCVGTAWEMILLALDGEWSKHPALAGGTEVA